MVATRRTGTGNNGSSATRRDRPEPGPRLTIRPGPEADVVEAALESLRAERVVERVWERDHTVWRPRPEEIANRLGWLDTPADSAVELEGLRRFADSVQDDGIERAMVLGMGGSSLAPEVYARIFGAVVEGLDLDVLDTTDPTAIAHATERLDPRATLFVVASKSGTTVETMSLYRHFRDRVRDVLGEDEAGPHFVAVTDPGSDLADLAMTDGFRRVFLADPEVGGRYSALTVFGLVPAAIVGVNLAELLDRAHAAAEACRVVDPAENPGARLGAALGALARAGRDKLTLIASPSLAPYAAWVEQLVAESTGKDGRGILPVPSDRAGDPGSYGDDRVFVHTRLAGEAGREAEVDALEDAGMPVVRLAARDRYDLGGLFFLWEFATAIAGRILDIQPFDQPNVEAAKRRTREMLDRYRDTGSLPSPRPTAEGGGLAVYGDVESDDPPAAVAAFLERARPTDYVAIQAYLPPGGPIDRALDRLASATRERSGVATTAAYGPRYLHSTGQLHKGDAGRGLFLMLTWTSDDLVPIPGGAGDHPTIDFGTLEFAQALGDHRALEDAGRRVLRVHLSPPLALAIERLADAVVVEGDPGQPS